MRLSTVLLILGLAACGKAQAFVAPDSLLLRFKLELEASVFDLRGEPTGGQIRRNYRICFLHRCGVDEWRIEISRDVGGASRAAHTPHDQWVRTGNVPTWHSGLARRVEDETVAWACFLKETLDGLISWKIGGTGGSIRPGGASIQIELPEGRVVRATKVPVRTGGSIIREEGSGRVVGFVPEGPVGSPSGPVRVQAVMFGGRELEGIVPHEWFPRAEDSDIRFSHVAKDVHILAHVEKEWFLPESATDLVDRLLAEHGPSKMPQAGKGFEDFVGKLSPAMREEFFEILQEFSQEEERIEQAYPDDNDPVKQRLIRELMERGDAAFRSFAQKAGVQPPSGSGILKREGAGGTDQKPSTGSTGDEASTSRRTLPCFLGVILGLALLATGAWFLVRRKARRALTERQGPK